MIKTFPYLGLIQSRLYLSVPSLFSQKFIKNIQYFLLKIPQIPGFRSVQSTTASVYDRFSGCCSKFRNLIAVDEEHFPQKSTRFTAVYSRDKEYL